MLFNNLVQIMLLDSMFSAILGTPCPRIHFMWFAKIKTCNFFTLIKFKKMFFFKDLSCHKIQYFSILHPFKKSGH